MIIEDPGVLLAATTLAILAAFALGWAAVVLLALIMGGVR